MGPLSHSDDRHFKFAYRFQGQLDTNESYEDHNIVKFLVYNGGKKKRNVQKKKKKKEKEKEQVKKNTIRKKRKQDRIIVCHNSLTVLGRVSRRLQIFSTLHFFFFFSALVASSCAGRKTDLLRLSCIPRIES
ncbi:hypothetical protein ASPTUDRAFT_580802 [Aspergillus tubingensis CBS 134.48]|uniref:Uncharacterized protein n=1 Tax=Aspergillus tubingensis (strain CBS 134.48) TaxID=767770 RepID=A0A1L9N8R9_ASPTC|nr:hypothetical protein ASPTUDRAFT_580802 [Aspergillus tubingensis CBS 134.48]